MQKTYYVIEDVLSESFVGKNSESVELQDARMFEDKSEAVRIANGIKMLTEVREVKVTLELMD